MIQWYSLTLCTLWSLHSGLNFWPLHWFQNIRFLFRFYNSEVVLLVISVTKSTNRGLFIVSVTVELWYQISIHTPAG